MTTIIKGSTQQIKIRILNENDAKEDLVGITTANLLIAKEKLTVLTIVLAIDAANGVVSFTPATTQFDTLEAGVYVAYVKLDTKYTAPFHLRFTDHP